MKYIFMKLGSTKIWAGCQAETDRIGHIRLAGTIRTLTCNCSTTKAAQPSRRCQSCRYRGKCSLTYACRGRCYLYPPGASNDRTITTTEPMMRGHEATPKVEEKDRENDEGAGKTGYQTTRGMAAVTGRARPCESLSIYGVRDNPLMKW